MDFFTHGLISFLMAHNFGINYGIFAAFMGVFPDFDVILIPLYIKFDNQILFHRGGVHSFFVLGLANLVGAPLMNLIVPGNILFYWALGFLASSTHLFCDILTLTHLKPFWPFSKKKIKLNIAQSVNIFALILSAIAWYILFRAYRAASPNFSIFTIIISCIIIGIIVLRVCIKIFITRRFKSSDNFYSLPNITPFSWKIIQKQQKNDEILIKLSKYNIFKPQNLNFREFKFSIKHTEPPIIGDYQAFSFTYQLSEVKRFLRRNETHLYCLYEKGNSEKPWIIYWFNAEYISFNWTLAVRVELKSSGEYSAQTKPLRLKKCQDPI